MTPVSTRYSEANWPIIFRLAPSGNTEKISLVRRLASKWTTFMQRLMPPIAAAVS